MEQPSCQADCFTVDRVGIDTVSFAWRPTDDDALWHKLCICTEQGIMSSVSTRLSPSGRPGMWRLEKPIGAAIWSIDLDHRLIFAEGRLGAILLADSEDRSLAPFRRLPEAAALLDEAFAFAVGRDDTLGDGEICVRRLDLAAELRFGDPADGIAALRALGHVSVPRVKVCEWRREGRTETVSFHRAAKRRALLLRVYDKGVEQGSEAPGTVLRFERQHRWQKADQEWVETFAAFGLPEELWLDGFERWAAPVERLKIGTASDAVGALVAQLDAGKIKREEAERLAGSIALAERYGEGWWRARGKPHLGRRRRARLAELGLSLTPAHTAPREVELGEMIAALRAAWRDQDAGIGDVEQAEMEEALGQMWLGGDADARRQRADREASGSERRAGGEAKPAEAAP